MLLGQCSEAFDDPAWTFELRYDGYRMLAEFGGGHATLHSRSGFDASSTFAEISVALATLPGGPHIVDGEVCVLDASGRSDFARLQARARQRRWHPDADPVAYCMFDLLVHDGHDITAWPLHARKRQLAQLFRTLPPAVLLVDSIAANGVWVYERALALQFGGIVAKRLDSPYRPGVRSDDWLAIKRPLAADATSR
jgi:bifunctional non-homologous end joining protein LigD